MNPFKVGDLVRIRGGAQVQRFGVEGTVVRLIGNDRIQIDLGFDPLWNNSKFKQNETVKVIHKVGEVELVSV